MDSPASDHDLLITLHEQVKGIRDDIKDIKVGTAVTLADHEARLRVVEQNQGRWAGAITLIAIAIPLLLKYLLD